MDVKGVLGSICGFLAVIAGIFLLNAFRDMRITWREVTSSAKKSAAPKNNTDNSSDGTIEGHQLLETSRHDEEGSGSNDSPCNSPTGSDTSLHVDKTIRASIV